MQNSNVIDQPKVALDEIDTFDSTKIEEFERKVTVGTLNPVLGMLFKPRSTMRKLENYSYPVKWAALLILCVPVTDILQRYLVSILTGETDTFSSGIIQDYLTTQIVLFLWVAIAHFLCKKLFKGTASLRQSFIAWGWGSVPFLISMAVGIVAVSMTSGQITDIEHFEKLQANTVVLSTMSVSEIALCWATVLTVITFSEVHKIAKWKIFCSFCIPLLIASTLMTLLIF